MTTEENDKTEVEVLTSHRRLQDENGILAYSIKISPQDGKVTITFSDTGEIQVFHDFGSYLYEYSYYFRRRMETEDLIDIKLKLCEEFLNWAYMYTTDFRRYAKDKEKFDKELRLYIDQFEYFKRQYKENNPISTTGTKELTLSTNEKVILLSYLGVLDAIQKEIKTAETVATLFAVLLDRDFENLKKSIRYVNDKPKAKDAVKTTKTLSNILAFANQLGFLEVAEKAQADIDKIDKK